MASKSKYDYVKFPWKAFEKNRGKCGNAHQKLAELAIDSFGPKTPKTKAFINAGNRILGLFGIS